MKIYGKAPRFVSIREPPKAVKPLTQCGSNNNGLNTWLGPIKLRVQLDSLHFNERGMSIVT